MKEQIKKIREEKGGFTLAELLIVVAIIGVLVAIAIPVFTSSLHSSQEATDEANARSLYADLQASYLSNGANASTAANILASAKVTNATSTSTFTLSDGETINLTVGTVKVTATNNGFNVQYVCGSSDGTNWSGGPAVS